MSNARSAEYYERRRDVTKTSEFFFKVVSANDRLLIYRA